MAPPNQPTFYEAEHEPLNDMLDDFDFVLDDDDGGGDNGDLAHLSRSSSALEDLLLSRLGTSGSDFMNYQAQDTLIKSMTDIQNFVWKEDDVMLMRCESHQPTRGDFRNRRPSLNGSISFDPSFQQLTRHDSVCMEDTAQRYHSSMDTHSSSSHAPRRPSDEYSEALMKLAYSMQRTEESRKHVMMQRQMLTPEQQHSFQVAKEHLRLQTQFVAQQSQQQHQRDVVLQEKPNSFSRHDSGSPSTVRPSSSIMDAFFSGSRGTLTTGLDQSRTQLEIYMGQMNQRTNISTLWG